MSSPLHFVICPSYCIVKGEIAAFYIFDIHLASSREINIPN